MGTRGFVGMTRGGQTLATYNHNDSYPSELGVKVLTFTQENLASIDTVAEQFFALPHWDHPVTGRRPGVPREVQDELFDAQGDIGAFIKAGYVDVLFEGPPSSESPGGAVWGYLVNVDTREVEIHQYGPVDWLGKVSFDQLANGDPRKILDESVCYRPVQIH